jgi:histone H3/H4
MIPEEAFAQLVQQVVQDLGKSRKLRFQFLAMQCLQEAAEAYLVTELKGKFFGFWYWADGSLN